MKIGILGSGSVARALGAGFVKYGHEVMLGTRDPTRKNVADWAQENAGARLGAFEEAARFGEMLVLAGLGRAIQSILELAGPANFTGKTVIDATNPIANDPPVDGVLQYHRTG
jgi:predicted dinucleotide-binding enzyme